MSFVKPSTPHHWIQPLPKTPSPPLPSSSTYDRRMTALPMKKIFNAFTSVVPALFQQQQPQQPQMQTLNQQHQITAVSPPPPTLLNVSPPTNGAGGNMILQVSLKDGSNINPNAAMYDDVSDDDDDEEDVDDTMQPLTPIPLSYRAPHSSRRSQAHSSAPHSPQPQHHPTHHSHVSIHQQHESSSRRRSRSRSHSRSRSITPPLHRDPSQVDPLDSTASNQVLQRIEFLQHELERRERAESQRSQHPARRASARPDDQLYDEASHHNARDDEQMDDDFDAHLRQQERELLAQQHQRHSRQSYEQSQHPRRGASPFRSQSQPQESYPDATYLSPQQPVGPSSRRASGSNNIRIASSSSRPASPHLLPASASTSGSARRQPLANASSYTSTGESDFEADYIALPPSSASSHSQLPLAIANSSRPHLSASPGAGPVRGKHLSPNSVHSQSASSPHALPQNDQILLLEARNMDMENVIRDLKTELATQASVLQLEQSFRTQLRQASKARITELKTLLDEREGTIEQLRAAANDVNKAAKEDALRSENTRLQEDLEYLRHETTQQRQRIQELEEMLRQEREKSRKFEVELLAAQQQRSTTTAAATDRVVILEVTELRLQLESLQDDHAILEQKCNAKDDALEKARETVEGLHQRLLQERAEWKQRVRDLEKKYEESLVTMKKDSTLDQDAKWKQQDELQKEKEQLHAAHQNTLTELQREYDRKVTQAITDLRTKHQNELQQVKQAHQTQFEAQLKSWSLERNELSERYQALKDSHQKYLDQQTTTWQSERKDAQERWTKLQESSEQELEKQRKLVWEKTQELSSLQIKCHSMELDQTSAHNETRRLELEVTRLKQEYDALQQSSREQLAKLSGVSQQSTLEAQTECHKLRSEIEELNRQHAHALATLSADALKLESNAALELELLRQSKKQVEEEVRQLQITLEASRLATETLRQQSAATAEEAAKEYKRGLDELQQKLLEVMKQKEVLQSQQGHSIQQLTKDHERTVNDLKLQLKTAEQTINELRESAQLQQVTDEIHQAHNEQLSALEEELDQQITRREAVEAEILALEKHQETMTQNLKQAHANTLQTLQERIRNLESEILQSRASLSNSKIEYDKLDHEMYLLREKYDEKELMLLQLLPKDLGQLKFIPPPSAGAATNSTNQPTQPQPLQPSTETAGKSNSIQTPPDATLFTTVTSSFSHQPQTDYDSDSSTSTTRESPQPFHLTNGMARLAIPPSNGIRMEDASPNPADANTRAMLDSYTNEISTLCMKNLQLQKLNEFGVELLREEEKKRVELEKQLQDLHQQLQANEQEIAQLQTERDFPPLAAVAASSASPKSPDSPSDDFSSDQLRAQLLIAREEATAEITGLRAHIEEVTAQYNTLAVKYDKLKTKYEKLKKDRKDERRQYEEELAHLKSESKMNGHPTATSGDAKLMASGDGPLSPDVEYLMQEVASLQRENHRLQQSLSTTKSAASTVTTARSQTSQSTPSGSPSSTALQTPAFRLNKSMQEDN